MMPGGNQTANTSTTIATWVQAIWYALEESGCPPHALFEKAGLDISHLSDPLHRYPVSQTAQLWELAVDATGNEAFGLSVAKNVTPSTFYALGFSALASSNSEDATRLLTDYAEMVSDGIQFEFEMGDTWDLILGMKPGYTDFPPTCVDAIFASIIHFIRTFVQWDIQPDQIRFKHQAPVDSQPYLEFFGCDVLFDQACNAIITKEDKISSSFSTANPALAGANEVIVQEYLQQYRQNRFSYKVREAITKLISDTFPTQKEVANYLGVSERKLQNDLQHEGVQYKKIVDEIKQLLAEKWLIEKQLSVSEIAWALGFNEVSSFTRAFKRWTGKSPTGYLKK